MLSRQVKLPNKLQWQKLLDKTWFYTKIIFALFVFGLIAYGWGTFYPNKTAVAKVNTELDKFSTTADYDKRVIRMINKIRQLEEK